MAKRKKTKNKRIRKQKKTRKIRKTVKKRILKLSKKKKTRTKKETKVHRKRKRQNKKTRKVGGNSYPRYYLNYHFPYIDELRDLVLKSSPDEKEKMTESLLKLGRVKLAIATGIFLNRVTPGAMATDLFIVGDDISRRKLRSFLRSLEADIGKEVRYVLMEKEEFQYRLGMFDRFIRVLLESPHEKLINRLGL